MPAKKSKKGGADRGQMAAALAAGAVAAGAAAAAAGYYFYASKGARENRRIAARWATKLKNDVLAQAKKAQNLDRATILRIVDEAAAAYATVRSVDPKQLERAAGELKSNWKLLVEESRPSPPKRKVPAKTKRAKSAKATRAKSRRRKQ